MLASNLTGAFLMAKHCAPLLLGDDAGFVTGQNFVVDGGMTRKMIYEE